jgi:hypothetical protein
VARTSTHGILRLTGSVGLAGLLLSACGSSTGSTSPPPAHRVLGEADNGHLVQAHTGDTFTLRLSSYWQVRSSGPLRRVGGTRLDRSGCKNSPPGTGCAVVVRIYRASGSGSARLVASRSVCGEALACSPGSGHWQVRVKVTP